MVIDFLHRLDPEYVLAIYVFGSIFFILTFSFISRKVFQIRTLSDANEEVLSNAIQGMVTLACISLGFTLAVALANRDNAESELIKEVSYIQNLNESLAVVDDIQYQKIRHDLFLYAQSIYANEWPLLKQGGVGENASSETSALSRQLEKRIHSIDLISQQSAQNRIELLRQFNLLKLSRQTRLMSADTGLPRLAWASNNISLILVYFISGLLLIKFSKLRCAALLTQAVVLSIFFANVLIVDRPYTGTLQISTEPLVVEINSIKKELER